MNISKYILLSFIFIFSLSSSFAQISLEQKESFQNEAKTKLETLTKYISRIANKTIKSKDRDRYIDHTLELFKPGAIMEVSSLKNGNADYPIRTYLTRLKNLAYDSVTIDFIVDAFYISNFSDTPDSQGQYTAIASIKQSFIGTYAHNEMGEFKGYSDITNKEIEVILKKMEDYEGEYWRILLGDVTVKETNNL